MKVVYMLVMLLIFFGFSCSFQPNESDGIVLMKKSEDTLLLGIIDSYYIVKKFEAQEREDTLFINISSITSPRKNEKISPVNIYVNPIIKYIKLQNDTLIGIETVPFIFTFPSLPSDE